MVLPVNGSTHLIPAYYCGQERIEKLLLCSVERDVVQQIDAERVIDRLDADDRRLALK